MTSNDLKMTSIASDKNKKKDFKDCDPRDNQNDGRGLIEQAFASN